MPVKSEAQRRAMYAAAAGKSKLGIPAAVGKEYVAASHGVTHLPKRMKPKMVKHKIGKKNMPMKGPMMPMHGQGMS